MHPQIDLLNNNAGIAYNLKACTIDGFELQFGSTISVTSHSPDCCSIICFWWLGHV